jgi:uncharacterized repeat protein (TIGR03803 family)
VENRWHTFVFAAQLLAAAPCLHGDGVLHAFRGSPDGAEPIAPLVADAAGNLYGTTYRGGGVNNVGAVFELSSNGAGGYTYREIYMFQFGVGDAENPNGQLLVDGNGNLFGTAMFGGAGGGVGAIFELSPVAGGGWSEKVIYSFSAGTGDGFYPGGGLISDAAGNLYGVTQNGGTNDTGTVFELSPDGAGGWRESVLYSFTGSRNAGPDGAAPLGGLVFDKAGNLFGTTYFGGVHRDGAVFELSPAAGGGWTEKIIHSFNGNDGCNPMTTLIWDNAGNLYGTTSNQGSAISPNCTTYGTVFKLTPPTTTVGWPESMVHRFLANDGNFPNGIVFDSAGSHLRDDIPGRPVRIGRNLQARPDRGRHMDGNGHPCFYWPG